MNENETGTIERRLSVVEKVIALNEQRVENHSLDIKKLYQRGDKTDEKLDAMGKTLNSIKWLLTGIVFMYLIQTIGLPALLSKLVG